MKQLQITEQNARRLYENATSEFKSTLEDTFGKEFFSMKITDRIKTYEDACAEIGEMPLDEKALKAIGFTDDEINYRKLKTIGKALNEGWVPDWTNTSESKWQPYFRLSSGAFVFSVRIAVTRVRVRGTAPAFALRATSWQHMQENSSLIFTKDLCFN